MEQCNTKQNTKDYKGCMSIWLLILVSLGKMGKFLQR